MQRITALETWKVSVESRLAEALEAADHVREIRASVRLLTWMLPATVSVLSILGSIASFYLFLQNLGPIVRALKP